MRVRSAIGALALTLVTVATACGASIGRSTTTTLGCPPFNPLTGQREEIVNGECRVVPDPGSGDTTTTATPVTPITRTDTGPCSGVGGGFQALTIMRYPHPDGPYPQPPACGAIIIQGDMQPVFDHPCEIRVFRTGEVVEHLGQGGIQINQVIGTEADIQAGIERSHQGGVASNGGGPCPVTKP